MNRAIRAFAAALLLAFASSPAAGDGPVTGSGPAEFRAAAESALSRGDAAGCMRLCDERLARHPADPAALFLKGRALLTAADFSAARPLLVAAADLAPDDPAASFELGRLHFATGRHEDALRAFLHSACIAPAAGTRRMIARTLEEAGHRAAARAQYFLALRDYPDDPALLKDAERFLRRVGDARGAAELYAGFPPGDANARMNLGLLRLAAGEAAEAETEFRAALAARPEATKLRILLADAVAAAGRTAEALLLYAEAVRAERPGEAENDLAGVGLSAHPCLDFLMANALLRLARWEDAAARLRKIYAGHRGNALAAILFDDAPRFRGMDDPSLLRSHAFGRDAAGDPGIVPPRLAAAERARRAGDMPALEASLLSAAETEDAVGRFGARLLVANLVENGKLVGSADPRRARLLSLDPASAPSPARELLVAAERLRGGDLPAFAAAIDAYLARDPELAAARSLLDRARPLDLCALSLEGIRAEPAAGEAGERRLSRLLESAALRYASRARGLSGDAGRIEAAEKLAALGFASAACGLLDAAEANFDLLLALERVAFDADDFARAAGARRRAAASPGADATALRRALAFSRRREHAKLRAYALTLPDGPDRRFALAFSSLCAGDAAAAREGLDGVAGHERAYLEGRIALLSADLRLARERFDHALAAAPGDPEYSKYLGISLHAAGEHAAARDRLAAAVEGSGGDFDALRYLAASHERLGEFAEAERCHRAACAAAGPGAPLAERLYGDFLSRRGRHGEAVARIEARVAACPTPDLHFNLGLARLAAGAPAAAADSFREALRTARAGIPRIEHHLAVSLARCKDTAQAAQAFRRAFAGFEAGERDGGPAGETPYPCRAIVHAASAVACGEWRACARVLAAHLAELSAAGSDLLTDTEIIKGGVDPDEPFFFLFDLEPTERLTAEAALLAPFDGSDGPPADERSARLRAFLDAQAACRLDEAIRAGKDYLALDPELDLVRRVMSARHVRSRAADAVPDPDPPAPFSAMAAREREEIERLRASGDLAAAARFVSTRIAAEGATADRLVALGEILWAAKRHGEAAAAFERALALAPEHPYALVGAACTARELGQSRTAETRFLEAARRTPPEEGVEWMLSALYLIEERGALDEAADRASASLERFSCDGRILEFAVRILKTRGRYGDLKTRLEAWARSDPSGRAAGELLDLKRALGEDAEEAAGKLFAAAPGDARAAGELFDRALAAGDAARAAEVAARYLAASGEVALARSMDARLAERAGSTEAFLAAARDARAAGGAAYAELLAAAKIERGEDDAEFREALREFAAGRGNDLPALAGLVARARRAGHAAMLQKIVNVAADAAPESPVWRQLQADLFLGEGKRKEAVATLEGALDDGTADLALVGMLVDLCAETGAREKIDPLLARASERLADPASRAGLFRLAVERGAHGRAFALYKGLHAGTGDGENRARAALDELRPDLLFAFLDTLPEDELDEPLLLSAARHKAASGDSAGALELYEEALGERPGAAEATLGAARALAALGRPAEALERLSGMRDGTDAAHSAERLRLEGRLLLDRAEFALAQERLLASLAFVRHAEALRLLGLCLVARGRHAEAETFLEEALLSLPDDVDSIRHLASVRERLGRPEEADRLYRLALSRAAGGRSLIARLHAESLLRRGDLRAATGLYARLLFELPSPGIFFDLGTLLLESGRPAEALAAFETAGRGIPRWPRNEFMIGVCLRRLGDPSGAETRFRRALEGFDASAAEPAAEAAPYPCVPLVHALAALSLGEYVRCGEVLRTHLDELSRARSDLLADTDAIKGGVDVAESLLFRIGRFPGEAVPPPSPELRASVFGQPRRLLEAFLEAQEACDLGRSLELARRYLDLDPALAHARALVRERAMEREGTR